MGEINFPRGNVGKYNYAPELRASGEIFTYLFTTPGPELTHELTDCPGGWEHTLHVSQPTQHTH